MPTVRKLISACCIRVGILLLLFTNVQAEGDHLLAADKASWATYKSQAFGVEFNYPKNWTFHESPGNRVIASFSFTTAAGSHGDFILSDMRPVRTSFDHYYQRNLQKAKKIPLGQEEGFERDEFECGQEDPGGPKGCLASFQFESPALFSMGIDASLDISLPYEEGRKDSKSVDPYPLFKDEVDLARQALATLKIVGHSH